MNTGFYLYAFSREIEAEQFWLSMPGIDPRYQLQALARDGLFAFVSKVNLEEFGRESLSRNVKDINWLEPKARMHDQIIRTLNDHLTIVPVRFGTIWLNEEGIVEYLSSFAGKLKSLLAKLEGAKEMGVTLHFEKAQVYRSMEQTDKSIAELASKIKNAKTGTAHLLSKQLEQMKREKLGEYVDNYANNIVDTLSKQSVDVNKGNISSPPNNPEHLYLSLAFLVLNSVLDGFRQEAARLQTLLENSGVTAQVTGPWPPYSFSTVEQEEEKQLEAG